MIPCEQPGCAGEIQFGYCNRCGLSPLPDEETAPVPGSGTGAPTAVPSRTGTGFDELPSEEEAAPHTQGQDTEVPETGRRCGVCDYPVGRTRGTQRGLAAGLCQKCGTPFSFVPKLRPGDLIGHYKVVGPLAHGGVGWVYLAKDTHLDDRLVAVKGLINEHDPRTAEAVVNEKKRLVGLNHENIVRIHDFVVAPGEGTEKPTGYIVMEYVGGKSLQEIKRLATDDRRPLPVEDVVNYGRQILAALGYLHDQGLVYCDMKPDNVIHQHRQVRLIDLGATCEAGFTGPGWWTPGYTVAREERKARGMQPDMDLFSVGKTLSALLAHSVEGRHRLPAGRHPLDPGIESLRLVLDRATAPDWRRRTGSAAEMSEQLDGVLRQLTALRGGTKLPPKPSARFATAPDLIDDGLGTPLPLRRWTAGPAADDVLVPGPLASGMPEPDVVARTLPDPLVDPGDPAAGFLAAVTTGDPHRLLGELAKFGEPTAEIGFARCRVHLAQGRHAEAEAVLREAGDRLGDDWRTHWHAGLLALHRKEVEDAAAAFTEVRRILPGELVPRLALGCCAQFLGSREEAAGHHDLARQHFDEAAEHYDVVWRTDPAEVSAAFGLARIALAGADRDGAVKPLDTVSAMSKHYDAARIAAIRVCAGRLGTDAGPDPHGVAQAVTRLTESAGFGPAHTRLRTEVQQAAFHLYRGGTPTLPGGAVLGAPVTEKSVRLRLERSFVELAEQAGDDDQAGTLVDLANTVRPRSWW
jgi:serine/threonine-protein kinase PknG